MRACRIPPAHQRPAGWLLGTLVLGLLYAGCSGAPAAQNAASAQPRGPLDAPPAGPEGGAARAPAPATPAPQGIYFLHEGEFGVARCVFVGDRTTAGAPAGYARGERDDRSRVVLELAEEARGAGGNVVMLPRFREDYEAGRLSGRVYRCAEPQRRAIYARAAAEQRLTVVP